MKKKLARVSMGFLLLPVCGGVLISLLGLGQGFRQVPEGSFYFALGFVGYFLFQWVFFKPMRTYVFGHELTHAAAAWMTGGEVHQIKISKHGGSVTVTKPNLLVALSPYIFPFYSMIVLALYFGINLFHDLTSYWNYFLSLLGVTLGFHVALTAYALRQKQPDLKRGGTFLSGILIFLGNASALVLLLGILFPQTVSWRLFLRDTRDNTWLVCRQIGLGGSYLWERLPTYASRRIQR